MTCSSQPALLNLCRQGLGMGVLMASQAATAVALGQLMRLLPDWELPPLPVWAVTPHRQRQPAKVAQAITLLRARLHTSLPSADAAHS